MGDTSGDTFFGGLIRAAQQVAGAFFSFGGPEPDKFFPKVVQFECEPTLDPSIFPGLNRAKGSLLIGFDTSTSGITLWQKQSNGGGLATDWLPFAIGGGGNTQLPATFTATQTGASIIKGGAAAVNVVGGGLAPANADGTQGPPYVLGVASTAIAHNATGTYVALGPVTYSAGEITALIGLSAFTPNTQYYVSALSPGTWSDTPPGSSSGGYAVPVAVALTTTTAFIQIGQPVGPL